MALQTLTCYLESNMPTNATVLSSEVAVYADHLESLPFVDSAKFSAKGAGKALSLVLVAHRKKHTFEVAALRTHLSMPEVERWISKARAQPVGRPLLLLVPYVSRPMGARLRDAGVPYVDQAGNLHLSLGRGLRDREALIALVEGKRPIENVRADAAWRAPGYQVLLALLVQPSLIAAPVRTIAAEAGVSTSPVLQVQKKLLQGGMAVKRRADWQWTPHGAEKARELWLHGYHTTLRPHLLVGRYRARGPLDAEQLERQVEKSLDGQIAIRWGGATAAYRLDRYYRGDRVVVHVEGEHHLASLAAMLRMVPDPEGSLIVLGVPGPASLESPNPTTVHPFLVWAELLEEAHDRASEAAERLASTFLKAADVH